MTHLIFGVSFILIITMIAYFYTKYMQGKDHDGRR